MMKIELKYLKIKKLFVFLLKIIESNNMQTNISYNIDSSGIATEMQKANGYKEKWINNNSHTLIYKSNFHFKKNNYFNVYLIVCCF